ncbi:HEAT repeat domain-containing protein [Flammeovirga sp. MY04]|uniref:HEAT repeat domain-containing protein n=1 Tax=Flammeovirga sp. MY04 TaxID=1191459 RepID=UPI0008245A17|nr:HEAT repeat domain-containing protein [Flammeovirga sp. MY04]ANQ52771.2 HEAT repeat domain-containing protein [Flammeovirga sp. MY04]
MKSNLLTNDLNLKQESIEQLCELGGEEIIDFLITLLDQSDSSIRDMSALALGKIMDIKAVEPLLEAIFKKENEGYTGTMVFALETLDCSKYLKEIFKIMFYHAYESKMSAIAILDTQVFEFTKEDLIEIKNMWQNCLQNPESCPEIMNEEVKSEMEKSVNSYLEYLK